MSAEATKAWKEKLGVSYPELSRRTGYPENRVKKVLLGYETSAPLLKKVEAALRQIKAEQTTTEQTTP